MVYNPTKTMQLTYIFRIYTAYAAIVTNSYLSLYKNSVEFRKLKSLDVYYLKPLYKYGTTIKDTALNNIYIICIYYTMYIYICVHILYYIYMYVKVTNSPDLLLYIRSRK